MWRLQEVLEITVFRKDIIERLIHNIVGGCVDEGGVLIDLRGGPLQLTETLGWETGIESPPKRRCNNLDSTAGTVN